MTERIGRCRGCGRYLDLDETQHGSHVVYEEAGVRECGPVDWVNESEWLRAECERLREELDYEREAKRRWYEGQVRARQELIEAKAECDRLREEER